MPKSLSIYNKQKIILLLITTILITSFVITTTVNYLTTRDALRKSLINDVMPTTSEAIYSRIKLELLPPIIASSRMAKDYFIIDWLKGNENNRQALTRYLKDIMTEYNAISSFLVSDKTSFYYNSAGERFLETKDCEAAQWYFKFIESNNKFALNCTKNERLEDLPTLFINFRVFDKTDNPIGVAGMGINLKNIQGIIKDINKQYHRNIFFTDSSGQLIPDFALSAIASEHYTNSGDFSKTLQKTRQNKTHSFDFQTKNSNILVNSNYIPELDWYLFVEINESEAMSNINKVTIINIVINFIAISLSILLVYLTVAFFHKKIQHLAITDNLTKVYNRPFFEYTLTNALNLRKRDKKPLCVLLIDFDHFKIINDKYGHLKGDQALIETTRIIQKSIRKSDHLCRWGGEEFVVLSHNCSLEHGYELAEKIRQNIEVTKIIKKPELPLTVSIGLSEALDTDNLESLLSRIDKALYAAKNSGRNCVKTIPPKP